jgi:hypothetical protein
MPGIFDVARYILNKLGGTTSMKLQKLCYYAQAWTLAWDDEPLFAENFQAWAGGPVCYELFKAHQGEFKLSADFLGPADEGVFTEAQRENIDEEFCLNHAKFLCSSRLWRYGAIFFERSRPSGNAVAVCPLRRSCGRAQFQYN